MKNGRLVICVGTAAIVLFLVASRAETQDPTQKPNYGTVDLKVGFVPDPYSKELVAGGPVGTINGGVICYVARQPDVVLNYTAGAATLTIYAESKEDTTLVVMKPSGVWDADDDSGGNLNPKLKFENPKSGTYYIWVGTRKNANAKATLFITER